MLSVKLVRSELIGALSKKSSHRGKGFTQQLVSKVVPNAQE